MGFASSPVEVLFVRPSIVPGVAPAVLVNAMFGFESWKIPYNEADKNFGAPVKVYDGLKASRASHWSSTATRPNYSLATRCAAL